ncbi:MAG: hypothetical protein ACKVG2_06175, partial [Candidatus Poseidoniales archaeon]
VRNNHYYAVDSWDSSSSSWQSVQSGATTLGSLSAPSNGWDASENETTHISYTDYRVTVRNASTTGNLVSQSQFRSLNMAPIACFDTKGIENSVAVVHVPITLDATCSSDPDSSYSNQDIVSRTWYIDGVAYNSDTIAGFFSETDTISIALEVEDDQGLVRWKNDTISIIAFPESNYTTISNISGQTTVRIDTNYSVNETLTWRPSWADAEVANKVIGVGLAFNFQRTHIGYVDVEIDIYSNGQFAGLDAEVKSSTNQYILNLKPQVQFYWYDVENQSNAGSIGFPVPSMVERYTNQTNKTINGNTVYLWDEYNEVYNGTTLVDQYGQAQTVFENITLSSIDLYPIIQYLVANTLPVTGQYFGFLNTFVDIEVLLEFGIMLELTMDNSLFMHSTTNGTFYDYDDTSSLLQFTSFQTSAYDSYTGSNSYGDVLDTNNITGVTAFSLYPYYQWSSETEVYGTVNLTIIIAPSSWLTSILSWFMEDPESLGQSWSYRLFESPTPIAASGNSGYIPITTRYEVLAPNYDGDSYWDGADTDDDNDGVLDTADSCSKGALGWTSYSLTDYDQDGCKDSIEDTDDDNDGISDLADSCSKGSLSWASSGSSDYDSDGCRDSTEDNDDDNDGISDSSDSCSKGTLSWISSIATDHDSDGCKDSTEDNDDDNDLITDSLDSCPTGITGWTSSSSNDYDGDGCQDSSEDSDDDNDNIMDLYDSCQTGMTGWTSTSTTDYDSDGCKDSTEDDDDDDDSVLDSSDSCPKGSLGWSSTTLTDYDSDGCKDSTEDTDDDNDSVMDTMDTCQKGMLGWTSSTITDYDADGCQDSSEDSDDDNDNVLDSSDTCQIGILGWTSTSLTDHDADGCKDDSEDDDDDGDIIVDSLDTCSKGNIGWTSSASTDHDSDGCQDTMEDQDDDNDGYSDLIDACSKGELDWDPSADDYDSDGCHDSLEDDDDDNDGVSDIVDSCSTGELSWISSSTNDYDSDGCYDSLEDDDDDGDTIVDSLDTCSKGDIGWTSSASTDRDSDGCLDGSEDDDDDGDTIVDSMDTCSKGDIGWTSSALTDHDSDGCQDTMEDQDDDNDEIKDSNDLCLGIIGWDSSKSNDYDRDGCRDLDEDYDDDNDGIVDSNDFCSAGELYWLSSASTDNDVDGCRDEAEDLDDDNDDVMDSNDAFPLDARYFLDTDLDGIADLLDSLPNNPDQSSDSDGDGYGDNSDGMNGDECPDEAHPETPNGCAWTAVDWLKANPAVFVGSPVGALILVGLAVLYLRRKSAANVTTEEQTPIPITQQVDSTKFPPLANRVSDLTDQNGYEWINQADGSKWYRLAGSQTDWQKFQQ